MEMFEVEERKNNQLTELTRNHDRAFNEMKNYYNDITLNNLALISSLKVHASGSINVNIYYRPWFQDQMEVLRKQNERMTKQVADLSADNRKLAEPLKQALADVTEYKRQLQNYEKDKIALAVSIFAESLHYISSRDQY